MWWRRGEGLLQRLRCGWCCSSDGARMREEVWGSVWGGVGSSSRGGGFYFRTVKVFSDAFFFLQVPLTWLSNFFQLPPCVSWEHMSKKSFDRQSPPFFRFAAGAI